MEIDSKTILTGTDAGQFDQMMKYPDIEQIKAGEKFLNDHKSKIGHEKDGTLTAEIDDIELETILEKIDE